MTKRKKIIWIAMPILLLISIVVSWYLLQPGVLFQANRGTAVFGAKIMPVHLLYIAMRDHERATGQVPQSIEQFTANIDPATLRQAMDADNAYARAVLLHNVRVSSGDVYTWILALRIPKGRWFDPPDEELIYVVGPDVSLGEWRPSKETERRFGTEVVEAALKKDREYRAQISKTP